MSATLAALSIAHSVKLHNEASQTYNRLRERFRAAYGTAEEERLLRLLTRAMERELRRALPIFT